MTERTSTISNTSHAATEQDGFFTIRLKHDFVEMLDQRELPQNTSILRVTTPDEMIAAIKDMAIRGAPAIGVAGAFGLVLSARYHKALALPRLIEAIKDDAHWLREARPTAVNLVWAIDRLIRRIDVIVKQNPAIATDPSNAIFIQELEYEAQAIHDEDVATCKAIGEAGKRVIPANSRVLTCCNTGSLATAGYGTALGVIRSAWAQHQQLEVYACETRPRLQGARLTAWELQQDKIPYRLITDNMAAWLMKQGLIDVVITGADRIALNGDSANKIGTYSLAVLAKAHDIPFYIAAPVSTIDFTCSTGEGIPIEEREADEIRQVNHTYISPENSPVFNPAFDVTPAQLINGIICEQGIIAADNLASLKAVRLS